MSACCLTSNKKIILYVKRTQNGIYSIQFICSPAYLEFGDFGDFFGRDMIEIPRDCEG